MPRPLDHQPQSDPASNQPVQPRDVRTEVAADEDDAPAVGQGFAEVLGPFDVEPGEQRGVVDRAEAIVARQVSGDVRFERAGLGLDVLPRAEGAAGAVERAPDPPPERRPKRGERGPEPTEQLVAPGRVEPGDERQSKVVKQRLPREKVPRPHDARPCASSRARPR